MKKIIQKNYVSNLNTVSALFDRFITEKIKQYFFFIKKDQKKVRSQSKIIKLIGKELVITLGDIIHSKKYNYDLEKRTFDKDMTKFVHSVENLIVMNLNIGKADNNLASIVKNVQLSRTSLERRSKIKNDIDDIIKKIIS
tara:strand:- start:129 stop:548 length:420 start_codon:yes stop_codon:yes gene_type:complete